MAVPLHSKKQILAAGEETTGLIVTGQMRSPPNKMTSKSSAYPGERQASTGFPAGKPLSASKNQTIYRQMNPAAQ